MRTTQADGSLLQAHDAQSDWFVREVKRCRAIGMPLGCCDEWPECSHVLAWYEKQKMSDLLYSHVEFDLLDEEM